MINESEPSKKQLAIELIRLTLMHEEQLDTMLHMLIHQYAAIYGTKNIREEDVATYIKNHVVTDEFLSGVTKPYEETFSEEELKELLAYYRSDVVKKFFKHGKELIMPLQEAYGKITKEAIEQVA
jgi:hypothetical protein